jgi:hypothetical protein
MPLQLLYRWQHQSRKLWISSRNVFIFLRCHCTKFLTQTYIAIVYMSWSFHSDSMQCSIPEISYVYLDTCLMSQWLSSPLSRAEVMSIIILNIVVHLLSVKQMCWMIAVLFFINGVLPNVACLWNSSCTHTCTHTHTRTHTHTYT